MPGVFRGLDDQVAVVGNAFEFGVQANHAVVAYGKGDFVAVVQELKNRLQLVVAVRATTEDVQHQVELGRGGQGQACGAHVIAPVCAAAIA